MRQRGLSNQLRDWSAVCSGSTPFATTLSVFKYSGRSLSRPRLSRITAYLGENLHPMVFKVFRLFVFFCWFRFVRVPSEVNDFLINNRSKLWAIYCSKQRYGCHVRTTFSKFYRRHSELLSKYNVGLKTVLQEGLFKPEHMATSSINSERPGPK